MQQPSPRLLLPVLIVLSLLVSSCTPKEVVIGTKAGNQAPELSLADAAATTHTLSSLKGKLVLIEFWDAATAAARRNHFEMQRVYLKYKGSEFSSGDGFAIYSVNMDADPEVWKKAVQEDGITFTAIVHDTKGWSSEAVKSYGINSLPKYFLVNENGIIINHNILIPDLERILNDQM